MDDRDVQQQARNRFGNECRVEIARNNDTGKCVVVVLSVGMIYAGILAFGKGATLEEAWADALNNTCLE